jgi:hypothetical protein
MSERGFVGKMLFMTGGLLVWAAHFTLIYGFNAVACARGFAGERVLGFGVVPFVIGAATVVALATTLAILMSAGLPIGRQWQETEQDDGEKFLRYGAAVVAMLSLVAIAWNAVPAFIVRSC